MTILYHFRTQGTGAEGVHIAGMAKAFESFGHRVVFSSPSKVDPGKTAGCSPFRRQKKSLLNRFAAHAPRFVFELLEIGYNAVACLRIKAVLSAQKIDVIYERHAFFLFATAHLARRRRLPLIIEVNELSGDERVRDQPLFASLARWAERFTFTRATLIVVVSPYLARRVAACGIPVSRILTLPNGVDEALLNAPNRGSEIRVRLGLEKAMIVGFVGWFVSWHRLERLLEVFAELTRTRPALRLLLVGDGRLRSRLEMQSATLGISARVLWPGAAEHQEISAWLDAMDVVVVPHGNEFRSPLKLFEAMARGRAIVAPRTEPVAAVIEHEKEALLFNPDEAADLRRQLARAIDDASLRARLGAAARHAAGERHTWKKNAARVLASLRPLTA